MRNSRPVAAFTVKHEMESWLERNHANYTIYRIGDGIHQTKPPMIIN